MSFRHQRNIVVAIHPGLNAAMAGAFVKTASRFDADIAVSCRSAEVNGKSILGLLSLCVRQGDVIKVVADGVDALIALEALANLFDVSMADASAADAFRHWPDDASAHASTRPSVPA